MSISLLFRHFTFITHHSSVLKISILRIMSEIKKHYMRAKRKTSQEESFSSNRSKIVTKKFCFELNTNKNSSQLELFEHSTLESDLLLNYESDENLSLSSDLQLVNFDINKSHGTTEEKNNLEEDI